MYKQIGILCQRTISLGKSLVIRVGYNALGTLLVFIAFKTAIVTVSFLVFGLMPVHREVQYISKQTEAKVINSKNEIPDVRAILIDKIIAGEHLETFLKSTLQLATADSISLLIDLSDSLAILTFKGVYLFESKISNIQFNKGLKKLPTLLRDSLFSGPIQVEEEISSIEKFPLVVKKAPKDPAEAKLANSAPLLPGQSDVFWLYTFGNNLVVEIGQQENDLVDTHSAYRNFRKKKSQWFRAKTINALKVSEHRGYTYHLSIEIPREDARSIYRALPMRPLVAVRY